MYSHFIIVVFYSQSYLRSIDFSIFDIIVYGTNTNWYYTTVYVKINVRQINAKRSVQK